MKSVKRIILVLAVAVLSVSMVKAQDEENGLQISGSVDTYYKYDFSGESQIGTSFAGEQNSVSLGMIDLALSQTVGKASFVGELSFGPRGQSQSIGNSGADGNSFHIQNLYASYAVSDVVTITAGYMGTFIGYEVISPAANFNYSTSYLFTNGPFQHAGIKADFAIADNFGFMVGVFNDWNVYQDFNGVSDIGAQIYFAPVDGWDIYLNAITGYNVDAIYTGLPGMATEIDLTTGYQISDAFYLGLNAATAMYSVKDGTDEIESGFAGIAVYPQLALSEKISIGYRGEFFMMNDYEVNGSVVTEGSSVFGNTLTLNGYKGPLTLSAEIRLDSGEDMFSDADGEVTSSATQFLIAAIYAF